MNRRTEAGAANIFLIFFIITFVLFLATASFGAWAYTQMTDYRDRSDAKVAAAVKNAETKQQAKLEQEFAEKEKSPLKVFKGSPTFGSVTFNYPKTWNVYVSDSSSNSPLLAYFKPNFVPAPADGVTYALVVELLSESYDSIADQYNNELDSGKVKATTYTPPKMVGQPNVIPGIRFSGLINNDKQGTVIIVKLRDKTLKVSTDGQDYLKDYENIVLASLTFTP